MEQGSQNILFGGEANNLGKNENDVVVFDNAGGYSTIALQITVPTGGVATFEATFDGSTWVPITLRDVENDVYAQSTDDGTPFIGSIAGARKFRLRTSTAGSANGTVIGTASRGTSTLEGIEFGWPPHRFGYTPVHKDASYATAQTGADIWTPATGKKFVLTDLSLICGGTTDAVVTIFDETNSTGNIIFKGTIDVSNNRQFAWNHAFSTPYISSAANNDLKITTSANITIDVVAHGYEI
jgi:hypothetical protein